MRTTTMQTTTTQPTTQPMTTPVTPTSVPSRQAVRSSTRNRATMFAAVTLAALILTGCGGSSQETADATTNEPAPAETADSSQDAATTEPGDDPAPSPEETRDSADAAPVQVARTAQHLAVHDAPGAATVTQTLPPTTDFDSPRVLLIVDTEGEWLEVLLPVRPNGTTGWVHADDVEVSEVAVAVEVDLDARELTVREAGEVVLTTEVAIGDPEHPTPTGTFSVTDKLDTGDPAGAYGPYAFGLSARSEVLTEFAGGDGQVGIHGTNDPASLGQAVSHGCIRVPNEVAAQLIELLPLGTPVTVS